MFNSGFEYKLTETMVCARANFDVAQEINHEILITITDVNSMLFPNSEKDMVYPQKRGVVLNEAVSICVSANISIIMGVRNI